jgi:hypothetical protein
MAMQVFMYYNKTQYEVYRLPHTENSQTTDSEIKTPPPPSIRAVWGIGYIKRKLQERRAKYETQTPEEKAAWRTANATVWIAIFTVALTIVGAITLYEVVTGSSDTHDLAEAAKKQAGASVQQVGFTAALAMDAKDQADRTKELADSTKTLADAAKAQSDTLRQQFFSSQQVIESQRANIAVSVYSVDHPMTFQEHGMSFAFTLALANNGAFAANDVRMRYTLYFSKFGQSIFTEPGQRQRDLCKPPVQSTLSRDSSPKVSIYPGRAAPEQINGGWGFADQDVMPRRNDPPHPIGLIPIVVGCVDYMSGAMPKWHQTGFILEIRRKDEDGIVPTKDIPANAMQIDRYIFDQGESH